MKKVYSNAFRASIRLFIQTLAVLGLLVSIYWLIVEQDFKPNSETVLSILTSVTSFLISFLIPDEKNSHSSQKKKRKKILKTVADSIEKRFEEEFHNKAKMELKVIFDPKDDDHYSRSHANNTTKVFEKKSIADIFANWNGSLLILGKAGSGKTVILWQLADYLHTKATENDNDPIPIILDLTRWMGQPLETWIAEEFAYRDLRISERVIESWLQDGQLALLLDGLDEVPDGRRGKCTTFINQFIHDFDVAVCSRTVAYDQLVKLNKGIKDINVVRIQPLTTQEIDDYLYQFDSTVDSLHSVLKNNIELQELMTYPLWLNLATYTYANLPPEMVPQIEMRNRLFGDYVQKMLRKPLNTIYSNQVALQWLHNLARGMTEHNQPKFYIEQLQATWLPDDELQQKYIQLSKLSIRLIVFLLISLGFGLGFGLLGGTNVGLIAGSLIGLSVGLMQGSLTISSLNKETESNKILTWKMPTLAVFLPILVAGFTIGIMFFLNLSLISKFNWGILGYIFMTFILTVPVIILILILTGILYGFDNVEEGLKGGVVGYVLTGLSTGLVVSLFLGLFLGLFIGPFVSLYTSLFGGWLGIPEDAGLTQETLNRMKFAAGGLVEGVTKGALLGLVGGFITGMLFGGFQRVETKEWERHNQNIRYYFINAVIFLLTGILSTVILGLILWNINNNLWGIIDETGFSGLQIVLILSIPIGASIGAVYSFEFGSETIIKHYVLRWVMQKHDYLPAFPQNSKLIDFLDLMAERTILRRDDTGWRFFHGSLQKYFAELSLSDLEALGNVHIPLDY